MATTSTATHSPPPPPPCHFATLSGELRNRIYSYFFSTLLTPSQTTIDIRHPRPRLTRNAPKTRSALALPATSRQLRHETLSLFWSHLSLRIASGTLTAYSQPTDSVPGVHPMNRSHHINQDRAECLREWLVCSGVKDFARMLRPVELDLGMWDPRVHADEHQFVVLRLLGGDTLDLTRLLRGVLGRSGGRGGGKEGNGDYGGNSDSVTNTTTTTGQQPGGCTLRFKVQVVPSTALGSICVANERKQALASIAELCEGRSAKVQAQFQKNLLTTNGHFVLLNDMAMCRSLAELLVGYIVEEEEEHVDDGGSKGLVRKGRRAAKKGVQSSS